MIDRWIWRILLLPVRWVFGIAVGLKEIIFRIGLLKGVRFSLPVISVGNLNVCGTGKTPHVEYLIRTLSPYLPLGVMSRGYKRKTSGFLLVKPNMTSREAGDEPLIYARKYSNVAVSVSESRALGIPKLLQEFPQLRAIVLDDAFQHRSVDPSYNILLTEYSNPFYNDWLLPSGTLREFRSGYHRADVIVVTKCPAELSVEERYSILQKINPDEGQDIFFSMYSYGVPYNFFQPSVRQQIGSGNDILVVCGIARSEYLEDYLTAMGKSVNVLKFADHHDYSENDIATIARYASNMDSAGKMIITTEKDAVRLSSHIRQIRNYQLDLWVLPVQVEFLFGDASRFNRTLQEFLLGFKI